MKISKNIPESQNRVRQERLKICNQFCPNMIVAKKRFGIHRKITTRVNQNFCGLNGNKFSLWDQPQVLIKIPFKISFFGGAFVFARGIGTRGNLG